MTDDQPPASRIPPAARAPYPAHPAPRPHDAVRRAPPSSPEPRIGLLGALVIGGAVAAAVTLAIGLPLFNRAGTPAPARRGRPRKA